MVPRLVDELRSLVGDDDVLTDDDLRAAYEADWTGRYGGRCLAVVRPRSAAAVGDVLRACGAHGVSVVPQGGNTGLVGGGVPRGDDGHTIVLSTRGITHVGEADPASMQITVDAGVTIGAWRDAARAIGLDSPVDFAARDSATVGGAIATNAGGSRVVRFGTMRRQVVGVEAVLADGTVVGSLAGLPKETAGLHWPSLLAGSEGTLGIITRARLTLVPWYQSTVTALVSVPSLADALELLATLRSSVPSLDAVELVLPEAYDLVLAHLDRSPPVERPGDGGCVVLVECAAHDDPSDELLRALESHADRFVDTAIATEPAPRQALLDVRDHVTEAIAAASTRMGTPTFKLDVAVPTERLGELLEIARRAADDDGCRLVAFGHLAEGNVHLNHLGASAPDRIADHVLGEVARLGGTISAEHGIGIAKAGYLDLIRSEADLAAQRALTHALDRDRLLNPGVLGR